MATAALGGDPEFSLVLLGEAAAYPHGSGKPQRVQAGEVVLMDCGCTVQGYQSDISRTFVFGEPTAQQRKVWTEVQRGQQLFAGEEAVGHDAQEERRQDGRDGGGLVHIAPRPASPQAQRRRPPARCGAG